MQAVTTTALLMISVLWLSTTALFVGARRLAEEISPGPYAPKQLTLGIFFAGTGDNVMSYEVPGPVPGSGIWSGYEVEILRNLILVQLADVEIQMVRLPDFDSRITSLQNGTVDFVMGLFAVTPARLQQVDFVEPYYYSSGTTIFAPDGCPFASWSEVNGTVLAMRKGYYAEALMLELGVILLWVQNATEAAEVVNAGEADGVIDNSIFSYARMGLHPCEELEAAWRVPAGIAVAKNNTQLKDLLSLAMLKLVEGGENAPILAIERETFIAAGYQPNPDLQALVANPQGPTVLNP